MPEVRYLSWSLIHSDSEPERTPPTTTHPPMLSNVALDSGSSLIFELESPKSNSLTVAIKATALSADKPTIDPFRSYTGQSPGAYTELPKTRWHKNPDGINISFTTRVEQALKFLKLHGISKKGLVISGASFTTA